MLFLLAQNCNTWCLSSGLLQVTLWVQFCAILSATVRVCRTSLPLCSTLSDQLYFPSTWWGPYFSWCCFSLWQTHTFILPFQSAAWLPFHRLHVRLVEIESRFKRYLTELWLCLRLQMKKNVFFVKGVGGWDKENTPDISRLVENISYCMETCNFSWLWWRNRDLCVCATEKTRWTVNENESEGKAVVERALEKCAYAGRKTDEQKHRWGCQQIHEKKLK